MAREFKVTTHAFRTVRGKGGNHGFSDTLYKVMLERRAKQTKNIKLKRKAAKPLDQNRPVRPPLKRQKPK